MKKLIILLLLSYTLFAQNISQTIPLALQKKLCDQLAHNTNRCENGSTIEYTKHARLTNGNLLLFVYLNEHSRTNVGEPINSTPIVVDHLGRWISTVGDNIITEDIESIHLDPHGGIWVRAIWHIEGVYPAYYHSINGLKWKRIILPKNRNVDCCFENVDAPIFLYNTLTLTFRDLDNKNVKSWAANYKSAISNQPLWQPLAIVPSSNITTLENVTWKVKKSNGKITFFNTQTNKKVYLKTQGNKKQKIYQIQVGAYSKKSSALAVQKALGNIGHPIYIREGKKYAKLFIGEFSSLKKAKFILAKLQREYPRNTTLKKAFVLKSKSK